MLNGLHLEDGYDVGSDAICAYMCTCVCLDENIVSRLFNQSGQLTLELLIEC